MDHTEQGLEPEVETRAAYLHPGVGPAVLAQQEQMAAAADEDVPVEQIHAPAFMDDGAPGAGTAALVPSRWTDICPYLFDTTGTWRATRATKEHRCTGLAPPAPLRADKQRRHCLVAAHVECPIYLAARDVRGQAVGDVDDPPRASRRGYARTAPVILERPAAIAVALATLRTSLPQVGLIVLMLLAVAALVLARFVSP